MSSQEESEPDRGRSGIAQSRLKRTLPPNLTIKRKKRKREDTGLSPVKLDLAKRVKLNKKGVPPLLMGSQKSPPVPQKGQRSGSASSGYSISYEEIAEKLSDKEVIAKSVNEMN